MKCWNMNGDGAGRFIDDVGRRRSCDVKVGQLEKIDDESVRLQSSSKASTIDWGFMG